jgi:hypothetical protein
MSEFDVDTYVDPPEPSGDAFRLRTEALPALSHPRPLEMFEESCRAMGLGGNLALATTVFLAATTRVIGKKKRLHAHTYVLGPASSGKSHELGAALDHLPVDSIIRFDGCSPRALIYSEHDIRHRVILYSEMDSLPMGNGEDDSTNSALSYLRTLVVEGSASYDVTVRTKDGFTTRRYTKEGPALLLVTGTRRLRDEQLASRLHEVEVTVDRARLVSVIAAQGRLLGGGKPSTASAPIVALQAYLQVLAPLEVTIPFADALGRAILEKAKLTDPRLTREFPRVAGFTAAHALLCIERRDRDESGAIVATLEDYTAARSVIRELSTVREFSKFQIETWDVVNKMFTETSRAVTVNDVAKRMLKAQRYVRANMTVLLQGGALADARDRNAGKTTPILVTPSGDTPCRILLPTVEELGAIPPAENYSQRRQVDMAHSVTSDIRESRSEILDSSLSRKELAPLGGSDPGGDRQHQAPRDPDVYLHRGAGYRAGDTLPDGRRVVEIDDGIPILARPRSEDEVRL